MKNLQKPLTLEIDRADALRRKLWHQVTTKRKEIEDLLVKIRLLDECDQIPKPSSHNSTNKEKPGPHEPPFELA
jgi:hypothetical protein